MISKVIRFSAVLFPHCTVRSIEGAAPDIDSSARPEGHNKEPATGTWYSCAA